MIPGNNIILRPLRMDDWGRTLQWRNDLNIKFMAMMHPYPVTDLLEKEWYEELLKNKSNKVIYFAIADKDDSPLGYIFLYKINYIHRNCYLGIVIGDIEQRGKGYGTESIKLLTQYTFKTLNMHKITVEVINKNSHAIKVYEKLGFVNEGCMKHQFFSDGIYYDTIIMSLFEK
jgi:RimJ/RimL family protein N-acetyltransferase